MPRWISDVHLFPIDLPDEHYVCTRTVYRTHLRKRLIASQLRRQNPIQKKTTGHYLEKLDLNLSFYSSWNEIDFT